MSNNAPETIRRIPLGSYELNQINPLSDVEVKELQERRAGADEAQRTQVTEMFLNHLLRKRQQRADQEGEKS